jgi:transcriptional regulator with AAA-type ATPase domain/tetratricopeptide (TPR) repeat protein
MDELAELLGESPAIQAVRDQLRRLLDRQRAGQRLPSILLQGETGTGKGVVARLLHRNGVRAHGPFVDVNCAAIPETLLEAELFGFEQGAFTDARRAKGGLFQAAHGGVLFLDEVALLPQASQAKLLSAIEERSIRRLGSTRAEPVDVWIISASNRDLRADVGARRFREDLFHRLAVLTIELPPLRVRGRDIVLLAERFLVRTCAEYDLPPMRLGSDAHTRLCEHPWPGNIRELANTIERAALFADGAVVPAEALSLPGAESVGSATAGHAPVPPTSRDEAMRRTLLIALEETGWNISLTAARLGVARNTVYARMEKFGLRPEPPPKVLHAPPEPTVAQMEPPPSERGLEWERRSLTLLRAEITCPDGVSPWSQTGRALDTVIAKVHTFGGRVEDVTPTGLVAVFGLEPAEDAPRRAAHAAITAQNVAQHLEEHGEGPPRSTIALHVVLLPIGRVGPRIEIDARAKAAQWPVLDALLRGREPGDVVASGAAAPFLERRFELARPECPATDPVYRLTGRQRRGLELWGTLTRFVGRENDLGALRERLARARRGHGQVVAVVGEAGVGKSRLIHHFAQAQSPDGWRLLEAACVAYGRSMSYLPVVVLLKRYFGIQDHDRPHEILEKLTRRLMALDASLGPTLPALQALLDLPVGDPSWGNLDPRQRRDHTHDAVTRLLLREARQQPLLVILEDVHWVDVETRALLDCLVAALASARVLLLVSHRGGFEHAWDGKARYGQIELHAFTPALTDEFLTALLGDDPGLTSLRQLLVKRGNPFFLEETVRTLVETEILAGEPGRYRLTQPVHSVQIPPAVQAILEERIGRLSPEERRLIQVASVIGRDVPAPLLATVSGTDPVTLAGMLTRAQASELLRGTPRAPERSYTFNHALVQEVAYQGLPPERRREIHAEVTAAIETCYAHRLDEHIDRLAYHALRGGLREKAVHYLGLSGTRATARFALHDARESLTQALDTLATMAPTRATLAQAFDVRLALRAVLFQLGEWRQSLVLLQEAAELADELNDDARRGKAAAFLTTIWSRIDRPRQALVSGARALEIAARRGDRALQLLTTDSLTNVYFHLGDFTKVVELAVANLAALSADSSEDAIATSSGISINCRFRLLTSLAHLGRFAESAEHTALIVPLAEATRRPFSIALAYHAVSMMHHQRGDWAGAAAAIERQIEMLRAGNIVSELPMAFAYSAESLAYTGPKARALDRIRECEDILSAQIARGWVATGHIYCALGRAYLLLDRIGQALAMAARGLASVSERVDFLPHAKHLLGDIRMHPSCFDAGESEACYRAALALVEPRGQRPLAAHCHLGLGKLSRRTGLRKQAHEHLTTATTMYRDMDMRFWLQQAEAELKELA